MNGFLPQQSATCRWLLAVVLTLTVQEGWAVSCSVSAQGVNFGAYDVFSNQNLDSAGNIGVTCDVSVPYSIALSAGSGSYTSRFLVSGSHTLTYNLYTSATYALIWGDGTSGTNTVNGSGTTANYTIYGRIPARQNAYVGNYAAAITVRVTY